MSPTTQPTQNPRDCSKFQNINTAFCISHMLFDKNNTCSHEPLQQTCYINKEGNNAIEKKEGCYDGFYARCYLDHYRDHIKNNTCIIAESAISEWCVCDNTKNEMYEESVTRKDCICFPHHMEPYTIYNLKEKDGNKDDSCVCSNIYRKKCNLPKDSMIENSKMNCTTVNEKLPMEQNMNCSNPEFTQRVGTFKKRILDRDMHPRWNRLVQQRKEHIMRTKNNGTNAFSVAKPMSQTKNSNTTLLPSSQQSLNETIDQYTMSNLKNILDHLLTDLLGNVNRTGLKSVKDDLNLTSVLRANSLILEEDKEEIYSKTNIEPNKELITRKDSLVTPQTTSFVNFSNSKNSSLIVPKFKNSKTKMFKQYLLERERKLNSHTGVEMSILMIALLFGVLFFYLINKSQNIRKKRNCKNSENRTKHNEQTTNVIFNTKNPKRNITILPKESTLTTVLFTKNQSEDKLVLIENEITTE